MKERKKWVFSAEIDEIENANLIQKNSETKRKKWGNGGIFIMNVNIETKP